MSLLTRIPRAIYDRNPHVFDGFEATGDWRRGTALGMAWLSQLAYEADNPQKVGEVLLRWDLSLVGDVIASRDRVGLAMAATDAFVAEGRGANMVAFAGTDPLLPANWATNLDILKAANGCARGFFDAAAIALGAVRDRLSMASRGLPLFLAGHSLGGALAVITALALVESGVAVEAVFTFGMPRPGNAAFAARYETALGARTYRMVYADDLVPTVAPSGIGFRHVGRLVRCRRGECFPDVLPALDTASDEPLFTDGVRQDWVDVIHALAHPIGALAQQLGPAARIILGTAPEATRTDAIGALIAVLPPRMRDHIPDRYCAALA
jgi:hypothetical protein